MKIYHRQGPLHFSEEGEEIFRLICCGTISCRVLITSFLLFLMLTKDAVKTNSNYLSKQTNQKIYNFFCHNSRVKTNFKIIINQQSNNGRLLSFVMKNKSLREGFKKINKINYGKFHIGS